MKDRPRPRLGIASAILITTGGLYLAICFFGERKFLTTSSPNSPRTESREASVLEKAVPKLPSEARRIDEELHPKEGGTTLGRPSSSSLHDSGFPGDPKENSIVTSLLNRFESGMRPSERLPQELRQLLLNLEQARSDPSRNSPANARKTLSDFVGRTQQELRSLILELALEWGRGDHNLHPVLHDLVASLLSTGDQEFLQTVATSWRSMAQDLKEHYQRDSIGTPDALLRSDDPREKRQLLELLSSEDLSRPENRSAVEIVILEGDSSELRAAGIYAYRHVLESDPSAATFLIDLLSDNPDPTVEQGALQVLGPVVDEEVSLMMIDVLGSSESSVSRRFAASSLGRQALDEELVTSLTRAYKEDPDPIVRRNAVRALGRHSRDRRVRDEVTEIATRPNAEVSLRIEALEALYRADDGSARAILIELSRNDSEPEALRQRATHLLKALRQA